MNNSRLDRTKDSDIDLPFITYLFENFFKRLKEYNIALGSVRLLNENVVINGIKNKYINKNNSPEDAMADAKLLFGVYSLGRYLDDEDTLQDILDTESKFGDPKFVAKWLFELLISAEYLWVDDLSQAINFIQSVDPGFSIEENGYFPESVKTTKRKNRTKVQES